jgi:solute carrier family 25 protein 33/36
LECRAINFYTYGNGKKIYTELYGKETAIVHLTSAATAGKNEKYT